MVKVFPTYKGHREIKNKEKILFDNNINKFVDYLKNRTIGKLSFEARAKKFLNKTKKKKKVSKAKRTAKRTTKRTAKAKRTEKAKRSAKVSANVGGKTKVSVNVSGKTAKAGAKRRKAK